MIEVRDLPTINALLNTLATVLLVSGYVLIRMGRKRAHQRVMIAALAASALFLTCYLIYHYQVGSVRFQKTGTIRTVYLTILLTHTVLAAAVPFLAGITVWRAYRGRLSQHRAIARWTLPIWLYVSVTGVVVYLMLYQM
jgi:Predicted membrane protein